MRFWENLRCHATRGAAAIVPEAFGAGVYILHFRELGIDSKDCAGLYLPGLDRMYQPQLEALGRWTGAKPCVLVNTDAIKRCSPKGDARWIKGARRRAIATAYHSISLHELAHFLDDDTPRLAPVGDEAVRLAFRGLILCRDFKSGHVSAENIDALGLPPWHGHEARFIRLCIHLAIRSQAAGLDCRPVDVVETRRYGLSSMADYVAALGREPERMAARSMDEIKRAALPAEFLTLWESDTRKPA